ncbi:MAG: TonB-dependent receptor, partial [Muribaculaceae bacterium]|nr:TonB-dependent receptor [Muribaculaceae bacterium]
MFKRLFLLTGAILMAAVGAFAQRPNVKCTGQVVDEVNAPLIGAIVIPAGSTTGVTTDIDGRFVISVPNGIELKIASLGYQPTTVKAAENLGQIKLKPDTKMLQDVVVTQSVARTRLTPVAASNVSAATIETKLGNQELPEVLKTTPGVWTTRAGGGFGDAKTNMRGFKSENVAIMVNGVPINDMEWGGVYWSNWAGLGDVASSIQTQRGLGATIVSTPSVGGTINITTRSTDAEKGGSVWYGMGNDGMNQIGMKVSTGLMKNGWALTVLGSRKWGDGYIQGTPYNSYNYFANLSWKINESHQLSFTAFGAPQVHYQRSSQNGLTIMGYQNVKNYMSDDMSMYRFNPTFGYKKNGQWYNSSKNFYHKPQISLAHNWKINDHSSLSTTVYASFATGGGNSGQGSGLGSYTYSDWYGATDGKLHTKFLAADGTFDYGAIQDLNAASTTGSELVMSKSMNSHKWIGLVSSYKNDINQSNGNRLALTGGLDLRYYIGEHKNIITDLFDGEYFIDYSSRKNVKAELNSAALNPAWAYEKLGVGDVVYRNYNGYVVQEGIYGQAEYTMLDKALNLVVSGAINNNTYWRRDFFYYDKANERSETRNFIGGTIKGGANYNIDSKNNVFFNTGFISRAPFFSGGVFVNSTTSNVLNDKPVNEKVFSFELGYGFNTPEFALTANAYYTKWMDKTTTRGGTVTRGEHAGDRYFMNMNGVDARHMGVELNASWVPAQWVNIQGMISYGDWIWDSNASGYFWNQLGQPLKNTDGDLAEGIMAPDHLHATIDQKGVKVGGSA